MAMQCSCLTPVYAAFSEESPAGQAIPDSGLASRAVQTGWQADARMRPAETLNPRDVVMRSDSRLACGIGRLIGLVLLEALLALLSVHAAGVFLDFMASIRYPFQWDNGEGIVWQQAALIPGPLMYSNSQSLPFMFFIIRLCFICWPGRRCGYNRTSSRPDALFHRFLRC